MTNGHNARRRMVHLVHVVRAGLGKPDQSCAVVELVGRDSEHRRPKRLTKKTGTYYLDSTSGPVQFLSKTR